MCFDDCHLVYSLCRYLYLGIVMCVRDSNVSPLFYSVLSLLFCNGYCLSSFSILLSSHVFCCITYFKLTPTACVKLMKQLELIILPIIIFQRFVIS